MDRKSIIESFKSIRPWRSGDRRAPHKPLLALYALGKLQRVGKRLHRFDIIDEELGQLLEEFGPSQTKKGTQDPFWRLQKNGVWYVTNAGKISEDRSGNVKPKELLEHNVSGGFHEAIIEKFQTDPTLYVEITQMMLDKAFPDSIHNEILQAVDIEFSPEVFQTRERSLNFRNSILRAYEYKCAVCGFDVKLRNTSIALEASHIKWKSYKGPSIEVNGLCLCAMHHKLFDLGTFTLSKELHILVSDEVHGTSGFKEWLKDFHGKKITPPQRKNYFPDLDLERYSEGIIGNCESRI